MNLTAGNRENTIFILFSVIFKLDFSANKGTGFKHVVNRQSFPFADPKISYYLLKVVKLLQPLDYSSSVNLIVLKQPGIFYTSDLQ